MSVQYQISPILVEQLPKGLGGRAFRYGDAVGSTEQGLVPVGECACGVICLEILFQPLKFGSNPGTRAAAWLRFALDIE